MIALPKPGEDHKLPWSYRSICWAYAISFWSDSFGTESCHRSKCLVGWSSWFLSWTQLLRSSSSFYYPLRERFPIKPQYWRRISWPHDTVLHKVCWWSCQGNSQGGWWMLWTLFYEKIVSGTYEAKWARGDNRAVNYGNASFWLLLFLTFTQMIFRQRNRLLDR